MIHFTLNGTSCTAEEGTTILDAAAGCGVYIPGLCNHPDLPPFHGLPPAPQVFHGDVRYENQPLDPAAWARLEGCGLCVVAVEGEAEPVRACRARVAEGMVVRTESETLHGLRRTRLMEILARHPHACITCAQREGCSLLDCSAGVPVEERCCDQFHDCELRRVAEHVGVKEETPRFRPEGPAALKDDPLFDRDFTLCIHCARCVRACNDVRGVGALGLVHHGGRLLVGSIAPTLKASECRFCGACVAVCPTGCLTDRDAQPGRRERRLVPCIDTCPAGGDVPEYIRRIAAGDFNGAAAVIRETLPLPNVLGYICNHLCEQECRRSRLDDPVAIRALKRFALENAGGAFLENAVTAPPSGQKVAVVGAGPAGLAAAHFLRFKGHALTVFEATESPGGMPALSIPEFRLPGEVLQKDVAAIENLGIEIRTGCRLDSGAAMANLLNRGFDAVLIAVGLPASRWIQLEGNDLEGVHPGLEFLSGVKSGKTFDLGKRVVVVGGGNVAVDAAMTALRISGGVVQMFCLERREEMPAGPHEVEKAEAEGVEIHPGWGPAAIEGDKGRVTGVVFRRCTAVFDAERNSAQMFAEADSVILALGQTQQDSIPAEKGGIFLAGDIAGGTRSVVHAVASGRHAAERIDRHLGGDGVMQVRLAKAVVPDPCIGRDVGFATRPRVAPRCAAPEKRSTDFRLIEETYTKEEAMAEASRCLRCDLRLMLTRPAMPPEKWLGFTQANVEQVPDGEGVFILAGADRVPTLIKGTATLRADLQEKLASGTGAKYFLFEEDRMYTRRETELIQKHRKPFDELDDLYGAGTD